MRHIDWDDMGYGDRRSEAPIIQIQTIAWISDATKQNLDPHERIEGRMMDCKCVLRLTTNDGHHDLKTMTIENAPWGEARAAVDEWTESEIENLGNILSEAYK